MKRLVLTLLTGTLFRKTALAAPVRLEMHEDRNGRDILHNFVRFGGAAAAAVALVAFAPSALADESTTVWNCQNVGPSQPEPLGDREGHAILVGSVSCRAESGPLAGGVMTTADVWEWDGPKAALVSFTGVVRKNGATLVWKSIEGKLELTKTEGKVTGFTVSGRADTVLAAGGWAPWAGKQMSWTGKPDGPASQFSLETKFK